MKRSEFATLAATGVAAATLGLASPAVAAPASAGSMQDTVQQLQAGGYRVILNKLGAAPPDQCSVDSVRPGRQITRPVTAGGGDLTDKVLYTTVYVDAKC